MSLPLYAETKPAWNSASSFEGSGSDIGQAVEFDREPLCEDERLDALLELAEHIGIERLFGL
jgi:hypothetical protein